MPPRSLDHHDVLRSAARDDGDPLTAGFPGLPATLALRDEITAEGSFFCTDSTCSPGGFTYVEVYDPEYWISMTAASRSCFHPMYRMRAASDRSVLDGQTVAFWITRYDDIVPGAPGGTAAPSVHFGLPLWYFRHESADSIAGVIFGRWGL
jgi:CubicO group peptidase (beta-lactamase class C family)